MTAKYGLAEDDKGGRGDCGYLSAAVFMEGTHAELRANTAKDAGVPRTVSVFH